MPVKYSCYNRGRYSAYNHVYKISGFNEPNIYPAVLAFRLHDGDVEYDTKWRRYCIGTKIRYDFMLHR